MLAVNVQVFIGFRVKTVRILILHYEFIETPHYRHLRQRIKQKGWHINGFTDESSQSDGDDDDDNVRQKRTRAAQAGGGEIWWKE